jgi:lipopolysaccharide export LptBFGC system permease protein LptF
MGVVCISNSVIHICTNSQNKQSVKNSKKQKTEGLVISFSNRSVFFYQNLTLNSSTEKNEHSESDESENLHSKSAILENLEETKRGTRNKETSNEEENFQIKSVILKAYLTVSNNQSANDSSTKRNTKASLKSIIFKVRL